VPFRIQRVPLGLLNLLNTWGGGTPAELEDRVRGTLDLTQLYALQQRRVLFTNNAALAEGGNVDVLTNEPPGTGNQWAVLFGATFTAVKTATATALRGSIELRRSGGANSIKLASEELGPFGATETGPCNVVFWAPYPIILVPPWTVFGTLSILGTDANANCTIVAEIGFLQQ